MVGSVLVSVPTFLLPPSDHLFLWRRHSPEAILMGKREEERRWYCVLRVVGRGWGQVGEGENR